MQLFSYIVILGFTEWNLIIQLDYNIRIYWGNVIIQLYGRLILLGEI